jgi:hypothetical protein
MSAEPYTIWSVETTFRKDGTPVMGTMGASWKSVIVMDAETFKRLCKEPGLAHVQWRVGTYE